MNEEKVDHFIKLIDYALAVMEERYYLFHTTEFYEKAKAAGWMTQEDINKDYWDIKEKYSYIYNDHMFLYIYMGLKSLKNRAISKKIEERFFGRPKGERPGPGFCRGMSDYGGELFGEDLYDYGIKRACGAVEDYYNHELE